MQFWPLAAIKAGTTAAVAKASKMATASVAVLLSDLAFSWAQVLDFAWVPGISAGSAALGIVARSLYFKVGLTDAAREAPLMILFAIFTPSAIEKVPVIGETAHNASPSAVGFTIGVFGTILIALPFDAYRAGKKLIGGGP